MRTYIVTKKPTLSQTPMASYCSRTELRVLQQLRRAITAQKPKHTGTTFKLYA